MDRKDARMVGEVGKGERYIVGNKLLSGSATVNCTGTKVTGNHNIYNKSTELNNNWKDTPLTSSGDFIA